MFRKKAPLSASLFFAAVVSFGSCANFDLHGNSGYFVSPNYPNKCPNNVNNTYRIILTTPGPQQVLVKYVFNLQEKDSSSKKCVDKIVTPLISLELCGSSAERYYLNLHGDEFTILFITDSSTRSKTFWINYRVLQNTSEDTVLQGNSGTFLSPAYPSRYSNDLHMVYRAQLTTPGPQQVRVDYVIRLEKRFSTANPCYDSIWIPEVDLHLCGTSTKTTYLTIEGNELTILFSTDWSRTREGFNFTYSVLEGDCTATLDWGTDEEHWQLVPITDMLTRNSLVMSVETCHYLGIQLTFLSNLPSGLRKQITIQPHDISVSACLGDGDNCALHHHTSGDFIGCCEFRSFWLQWNSTSVTVGSGTTVGLNLIVIQEAFFSMDVRFFHLMALLQGQMIISLDAPLPESYCNPSHTTPQAPPQCTATTTISPSNDVTTFNAVSTTDGPGNDLTTSGVISSTNNPGNDPTTSDDISTVSPDSIATTTSDISTSPDNFVTTTSDISTSPDNFVTTTSDISTSPDNFVTTTPDISTSPDNFVTTTSDISTSPDNVVTTTSDISTSPDNAVTTTSDISTSPDNVVTTTPDISTSPDNVVTTTSDISTSPDNVVTTTSDISTSPDNVVTTTSDISTSPDNFVTTTSDISTSPDNVVTTTSDISTSPDNVVTTTPDISTSPDNVVTTTSDISTSPDNVVTTTSDISTSPDNVVTTTSDISTSLDNVVTTTSDISSANTVDDTITTSNDLFTTNSPENIITSSEDTSTTTNPGDDSTTIPIGGDVATTTDISENVVTTTSSNSDMSTTAVSDVTTASSVVNDAATASTTNVNLVTSDPSVVTAYHDQQITTNPGTAAPPRVIPCTHSCRCAMEEPPSSATGQTNQALEQKKTEMAAAIKKDMTMSTSNVSANVRRKTSAVDERDSSTYMGFVIGLICFSPLVLIVVSDCLVLSTRIISAIRAKLRC